MEITLKLDNDDAKLFLMGALRIDAKGLTEEALTEKTKETLLGAFYKAVGDTMLASEVSRLTGEVTGLLEAKLKSGMEE